jgi:hypothetical protein
LDIPNLRKVISEISIIVYPSFLGMVIFVDEKLYYLLPQKTKMPTIKIIILFNSAR